MLQDHRKPSISMPAAGIRPAGRLPCLALVVLLAVLLWPWPCRAEEAGQPALARIRLQLKWRHQFQFAGYYAAIAKGFFRDEGLAVELIEGEPGIEPVDRLLTGQVDFAVESPAVLIRRQQGLPIVAVAAIFQHSPALIISRAESGLETPHQLRGKRLMLTPETDPECQAMLMAEGLALPSVQLVPHSWRLTELIAGRVDAQTAYLPNEPYLLREQGIAVNLLRPVTYGIDFYGDCIVTTEHMVRAHLDRLEAFRRAVQRGWQYAMANPREIAELILASYSREKDLEQLLFEAEAMRELILPDFVEIGHMNPARWQHIAEVFVKLGMMAPDYQLHGFLYGDLRDQLVAERHGRMRRNLIVFGLAALSCGLAGLSLFVFNRKLSSQVRQRTASLAASERNFRAFFEMASVGVAQVDAHSGSFRRMNRKYCEIVGRGEVELASLGLFDLSHPEELAVLREQMSRLAAGSLAEFTIEIRCLRPDGVIVWVILTASPLWQQGEPPESILVVIRDISARKIAEERLVFAAKVFENSIEGIVVTDARGTILQVNGAFTAITGYRAEEAIGRNPRILKSDKHPASFYQEMWQKITGEGQWAGEIWNRRKSGEVYPEWLTISAVRSAQGKITNFVSIFHDISENLQQQEMLKHQAHHDALTGLPNRVLINDRLQVALAKMKRSQSKLALLYLDLDNFKHINDAFGHTAGDNLLIEVARRLSGLMRGGDTIARLGGDEFLILLTEVDHVDAVGLVANRVIDSLKRPFFEGGIEFFVSASIGVTVAPDDGLDPVTLVKNGDVAMYRAKNLGRNCYQFFAPELDIQAHRRITMEMKLRKAMDHGEFELHYQPLVDNVSGEIVGAEALIRWRSAGELISPAEFIPLAEASGLILPLGEWILNTAARQAKSWQDEGFPLPVSVNISSCQFAGQDLVALLEEVLAATGLAPERLYFEVTESMLIGDLATAQRKMGALRQLGTRFYLDDFGTGYSSLSYLKRLPIDGLKIDRSFIKDIGRDPESRAIVEVIISLARILRMAVVAEGVETEEQWQILREMGEMRVQGYLVSRPVSADRFEALLRGERGGWPRDLRAQKLSAH